ncbi:MAG TPA: hypothetical protein VEF04_19270 [Blastocatellia bacterium]|nr:hypothetical protein [Blastocatellia bacterium]
MQSREQLTQIAIEHCRKAAAQNVKGELFIEVNDADQTWNPRELRHIYEQQMTVWRRYGEFEVIVDESGEMVGFIDHDKYNKSVGGVLSEAEAQALIKKAKLLPSDARFIKLQEHQIDQLKRTFRATYALTDPLATHSQVEVEINSTTREIIALRPIVKKEKPKDDGARS